MASFIRVLFIINCAVSLHAGGNGVEDRAADYICLKAHDAGKVRLALYPLTDEAGDTTVDTQRTTTRIMELIISRKEFHVIAPDQISRVLDEQEKGMTGLVDPDSAPETGKLLGADTLVFMTGGSSRIQVRMIDAVTGEMIGATVQGGGGNAPSVQNDDMTQSTARDEFEMNRLNRQLKRHYRTRPFVYLYETSTDTEWGEVEKRYPGEAGRINKKLKRNSHRKERYDRIRDRVNGLRSGYASFNNRIIESRTNLMAELDKRKRPHDDDDD